MSCIYAHRFAFYLSIIAVFLIYRIVLDQINFQTTLDVADTLNTDSLGDQLHLRRGIYSWTYLLSSQK